MAHIDTFNVVGELVTITGTGEFPAGSALVNHTTIASRLSVGDTMYYAAWKVDGSGNFVGGTEGFECGLGTRTATGLARTTVLQSSNSDALVSYTAGSTVQVFMSAIAQRLAQFSAEMAITMAVAAATPAAPPADVLKWYAAKRAGYVLPSFIGPSGVDQAAQPQLWANRVSWWAPGSGTTVTSVGLAPTTAATLSHPALATATQAEAIYRTRFQTSTTAGNASGARDAVASVWRGNAAGRGGFFAFNRFMSGSIGLAGGQVFVGLSSSVAALAGEPSALADCWGVGKDIADTNWQFLKRAGSGTVSKTSLGVSATALNNTFDLALYCQPNGSTIYARVDQLTYDGGKTTLLDQAYTTGLPAATAFLARHVQVRNGATAAAANVESTGWFTLADR